MPIWAYESEANHERVRLVGGRLLVPKAVWSNKADRARLESWNRAVGTVRQRIETIFGTCRRSHGLRRMRRLGLVNAGRQVRLTAIASRAGVCPRAGGARPMAGRSSLQTPEPHLFIAEHRSSLQSHGQGRISGGALSDLTD
jgi:hypothetical protein